jgi:hypothetical protein
MTNESSTGSAATTCRWLRGSPHSVPYFADAGWHNDDGIGVHSVKFATYFAELNGANGALRFVPCSHHADGRPHLRAYQRAGDKEVPGFIVGSRPGDVVAFDLHTFHAAFGGRDRLAWTTAYVATPEDLESREKTLRSMTHTFEQSCRGFNRERYPVWRDGLANPDCSPQRAVVIERLHTAGILDLPGAELAGDL